MGQNQFVIEVPLISSRSGKVFSFIFVIFSFIIFIYASVGVTGSLDTISLSQVIIRSTLPVHFVTASGTGFASDVEGDIWRCLTRVPHPVPHPTNHFLLDMVRRHSFRFLDSFPIYYERGDLMREDQIDCFHHCYTPELVWPELVLLTQLIKH